MGVTAGGRLTYHVVDVFTDRAFAGNPLAVVLGADELTGDQMQSLATEFSLSETAFPLTPTTEAQAQGANYRLRIFTPDVELPFAGHPSVGSAWLLRKLGQLETGTVVQECGAGLLPLSVTDTAVTLTGGQPSFGDVVDASQALRAVGLSSADLTSSPPRITSAGLAYVVLPVRKGALERCTPDIGLLQEHFGYPSDASGVYVVSWDGPPNKVDARMFAGDIGAAEDSATGSAALALGVYLGGSGLLPGGRSTIEVSQGVAMGRPAQLSVTCVMEDESVERVTVSGNAVHIAEGTVVVP